MHSPILRRCLGTVVTISFWHFLGAEGLTQGSTPSLIFFWVALITLILIYRIRISKGKNCYFILFFIYFLIVVLSACFRSFLFSLLSGTVVFFFGSQEGSLSLPDPSGGPSHSHSWKEDSFEIDVLLEETETTTGSESAETGTSVNQPESGRVPPATHVAPRGDEAGPSNQPPQGVPYPYHPEQVIGGDSVLSIERRLLSGQPTPSPLDIYLARIDAEDLFEAKVQIVQRMAELDPTGDWERRGARALDNPRSVTGESSLERLHSLLGDLEQNGRGSETFRFLKSKIFRRETPPLGGLWHIGQNSGNRAL